MSIQTNFINQFFTNNECKDIARKLVNLIVEKENPLNWDECIFALEKEISEIGKTKAYGNLTFNVIACEVNGHNSMHTRDNHYQVQIVE